MSKKKITSERELAKVDAFSVAERNVHNEDVKAIKGKSSQERKNRCQVKLPVLKLEDLVDQVTEENAHKEVSTGPSVGNEIW